MSKVNVVRAWKDATYRNSLSREQFAQLPANPAGKIVVSRLPEDVNTAFTLTVARLLGPCMA